MKMVKPKETVHQELGTLKDPHELCLHWRNASKRLEMMLLLPEMPMSVEWRPFFHASFMRN
jgi:hypothetical protein